MQLGGERDGLIYIPRGRRADTPGPLAVMLHGAGGRAQGGIAPFLSLADEAGMILLAPDSRASTWDMIAGEYGPDIAFMDRALNQTFRRFAIDPSRLAIEGFSDGASYAVAVGLGNAVLFSHVIGFSPGFAAPALQEARPRMFISHGMSDTVLPIDVCSRSIVPRLVRAGYEVVYREFDGGHTVPKAIAREAVEWFLGADACISRS